MTFLGKHFPPLLSRPQLNLNEDHQNSSAISSSRLSSHPVLIISSATNNGQLKISQEPDNYLLEFLLPISLRLVHTQLNSWNTNSYTSFRLAIILRKSHPIFAQQKLPQTKTTKTRMKFCKNQYGTGAVNNNYQNSFVRSFIPWSVVCSRKEMGDQLDLIAVIRRQYYSSRSGKWGAADRKRWQSCHDILLLIKKGHKRLNMATGTSNDDHATGREKSNRASEECVSGGVAGECRCGWQTEVGKADKRFFHSSVFVEAVTSN